MKRYLNHSNVVTGSLWMLGITLVLFFLPVINGLIGGFVGGRKVGSMSRALMAAILPAIVAGAVLWLFLGMLSFPFIGFVAGAATGIWVLATDLGILIGAAIGGASAERGLIRV